MADERTDGRDVQEASYWSAFMRWRLSQRKRRDGELEASPDHAHYDVVPERALRIRAEVDRALAGAGFSPELG